MVAPPGAPKAEASGEATASSAVPPPPLKAPAATAPAEPKKAEPKKGLFGKVSQHGILEVLLRTHIF